MNSPRFALAGKHHHLFTEQIEVKQSVDLNITLVEVQAAVHAVVQSEHISECDAALRLAEQLADVPEVAAMLRELADRPEQLDQRTMDHDDGKRNS